MATRSHDGDLDGEDSDEDAEDDAPAKLSIGERIRSGLQPDAASRSRRTNRPTTAPSSKQVVERLDDRERRLCFAASGLAVVAGVLIYVVETENKHFRLTKGELTPQTSLIIGLVVGALLLGGTLLGRRAPVGFVALFGFLAFGTQYLAGIPFLVLAIWLLVRSYKFQKEAAATRKAAMADGTSTSRSRSRGSAATASTGSGNGRSSSKGTAKKGPTTAEANKRYTPKRPAPPPPKPSRRDRKTAQTSD